MSTAREPERLWFLNTLVTVRVAAADGANGMTVLEHTAPFGDSPPLHVHHNEDEVFHVLSGEVRIVVGGQERTLRAGDTAQAPAGIPHTYVVVSVEGARLLTVTCRGDFERLVRSLSRPAERDGLPPAAGAPTPEQRPRWPRRVWPKCEGTAARKWLAEREAELLPVLPHRLHDAGADRSAGPVVADDLVG